MMCTSNLPRLVVVAPMSAAPRDGSEVRAWSAGGESTVVRWVPDDSMWRNALGAWGDSAFTGWTGVQRDPLTLAEVGDDAAELEAIARDLHDAAASLAEATGALMCAASWDAASEEVRRYWLEVASTTGEPDDGAELEELRALVARLEAEHPAVYAALTAPPAIPSAVAGPLTYRVREIQDDDSSPTGLRFLLTTADAHGTTGAEYFTSDAAFLEAVLRLDAAGYRWGGGEA